MTEIYFCKTCGFETHFADLMLGHLLMKHEALLGAAIYGTLVDIYSPAEKHKK